MNMVTTVAVTTVAPNACSDLERHNSTIHAAYPNPAWVREERSEFRPSTVRAIEAKLLANKGVANIQQRTIGLTSTDRTDRFRLHRILDLMQLDPVAPVARPAAVVHHGPALSQRGHSMLCSVEKEVKFHDDF